MRQQAWGRPSVYRAGAGVGAGVAARGAVVFGAAGGAELVVVAGFDGGTGVIGAAASYIAMMSRVISVKFEANRMLFGWPLTSMISVNPLSVAYFCSTCIILLPSSFRTRCCS